MKIKTLVCLLVLSIVFSCKEDTLPKPKAQLRLEYPQAKYMELSQNCNYSFDVNALAVTKSNNNCDIEIRYPNMNGTIFITYKKVDGNLKKLVIDAEKLTYDHTVKADGIRPEVFENPEDKVYGVFHEVDGNAASQAQFFVTDSTNHFLTGALYFNTKPNYDSILPAAAYLKKDMRIIMESLRWRE